MHAKKVSFLLPLLEFISRNSNILVECFFEDLHRDDKMTVTFLAGPGTEGNHDIEFWVCLSKVSILNILDYVALRGQSSRS